MKADVLFWIISIFILALGAYFAATVENQYYFFAGYTILQATIMATAWNILGGFTGYVNFGSAGFFGLGAYTSIALHTAFQPPLIVMIVSAAVVCGLLGLGTGKDLDCYPAAHQHMLAQVDVAHPAGAERLQHPVLADGEPPPLALHDLLGLKQRQQPVAHHQPRQLRRLGRQSTRAAELVEIRVESPVLDDPALAY